MHSCLTRLKRGDTLYYRTRFSIDNMYYAIKFKRYNTYNRELIIEDSDEEETFNLAKLKVVKIVKAK